MANYIRIYFKNVEHDTVQKLLDDNNIYNITVKAFLDIKDPFSELKNRDYLFNSYTERQKKKLALKSSSDISETTPIYPPCILYCPENNIIIETIKYDTKLVINKDFNSFLSDKIKNLIDEDEINTNEFTKSYPKCSIWIWCKSMIDTGSNINERQISGTLINISDFLTNVSTNVSETGGNFSISVESIPPTYLSNTSNTNDKNLHVVDFKHNLNSITNIDGKFTEYVTRQQIDKNAGFNINAKSLKNRKNKSTKITSGNHNNQRENTKRTNNLINLAVNKNDIVFIKFETLKEGISNKDFVGAKPCKEYLPGNYFDMIGLVDTVSTNTDSQSVNISIQGRDLMKLLLDDSSYFFTQSYSNKDNEEGVFMNAINNGDNLATTDKFLEGTGNAYNRFFATGLIMPFWNPTIRNIETIVDVIVKSLSNIQICPDNLFEPYLEKRTTFKTEEIKNKK